MVFSLFLYFSILQQIISYFRLQVVGCGRDVARIEALTSDLQNVKGELMAIRCDLRSEEDITAMFETIQKQWGGVDICINNAGQFHFYKIKDLVTDILGDGYLFFYISDVDTGYHLHLLLTSI